MVSGSINYNIFIFKGIACFVKVTINILYSLNVLLWLQSDAMSLIFSLCLIVGMSVNNISQNFFKLCINAFNTSQTRSGPFNQHFSYSHAGHEQSRMRQTDLKSIYIDKFWICINIIIRINYKLPEKVRSKPVAESFKTSIQKSNHNWDERFRITTCFWWRQKWVEYK